MNDLECNFTIICNHHLGTEKYLPRGDLNPCRLHNADRHSVTATQSRIIGNKQKNGTYPTNNCLSQSQTSGQLHRTCSYWECRLTCDWRAVAAVSFSICPHKQVMFHLIHTKTILTVVRYSAHHQITWNFMIYSQMLSRSCSQSCMLIGKAV